MNVRSLINLMKTAENLKNNTRHSWTSTGRHESVAEHSWRLALLALFVRDEFPEAEARLYKALDKMETLIQHNEADTATWLPLEHELNMTYGSEQVALSPFLNELKRAINDDSRAKTLLAKDSMMASANHEKNMENGAGTCCNK